MMDKNRYGRDLSKLFAGRMLRQIAERPSADPVGAIVRHTELGRGFTSGDTLSRVFDRIFDHLCRSYRSEYVYKNAIATNIVIGRHSLGAATYLAEFRVNRSKADAIVLNGTSTVYEIKSEFDNLSRLSSQLADYGKVFDRICVVTHERDMELVRRAVPAHVGILMLTRDETLQSCREPGSNKARVDPAVIFSTLRQKEYLSILAETRGFIPTVPAGLLYKTCLEQFRQLSPHEAHDAMVRTLRLRSLEPAFLAFVAGLPRSLKSAGLVSGLTPKQRATVLLRLQQPYII